ncbi:hypothetical protein Tco_1423014 [Tanacetum coccineum]
MNTPAKQTSLDNALVSPDNRVKIDKCNMRIIPTITKKEPTYQVILDALALSPLYPSFLITAEFKLDKKKCRVDVEVFRDILQICPRHTNQEFVEPSSSDEEIVSFIKELSYKGDIKSVNEVFTDHMHQPWRTFTAIINRTLFETMTKTKSFDKNPKHGALYHALMESILEDEDAMDKGVVDKLKKIKPDDSAQAEETVFEARDTQVPQNLGEDTSKTNEIPTIKADPNDWFKKPKIPPNPDPEWNTGKTVDDGPTQNWLSISDLTKADLVGPVYNLLKGTCKSYVELEYNMEEFESRNCLIIPADYFFNNDLAYLQGGSTDRTYTTSLTKTKASKYDLKGIEDMVPTLWSHIKVVYDKHALLVTIVKVNKWYGYGHLEEIEVRRADQQLYKFMEGDFLRLHLNGIEDMLLLIVQNKLFNFKSDIIVNLSVALHMFTRRIVIQKRVEDLQLGIESYKKKLNISKPRTRNEDLSQRAPYTSFSDLQGVIYEDKLNKKRLMRSNELHKFSDGTFQLVQDTLHDMATNLRMRYNKAMPRRR